MLYCWPIWFYLRFESLKIASGPNSDIFCQHRRVRRASQGISPVLKEHVTNTWRLILSSDIRSMKGNIESGKITNETNFILKNQPLKAHFYLIEKPPQLQNWRCIRVYIFASPSGPLKERQARSPASKFLLFVVAAVVQWHSIRAYQKPIQ